jgi:hypothetical protein
MGENRTFTCSNDSCKKVFTVPLKTLNLQQYPTEPYYACPFCLTKITENLTEKNEPERTQVVEVPQPKERPIENKEKPSGCRFHLGYLSERVQKEQIPDDCMVCKDIVDCMLRKMRT